MEAGIIARWGRSPPGPSLYSTRPVVIPSSREELGKGFESRRPLLALLISDVGQVTDTDFEIKGGLVSGAGPPEISLPAMQVASELEAVPIDPAIGDVPRNRAVA